MYRTGAANKIGDCAFSEAEKMNFNRETGETIEDCLICVRCNTTRNAETGEYDYKKSYKEPFKIPSRNKYVKVKTYKEEFKCILNQYVIFVALTLLSLTLALPPLGVLLWLSGELVRHICLHRRGLTHGMPTIHKALFSEFCAICQSKRRMEVIGKLQDERKLEISERKLLDATADTYRFRCVQNITVGS